MGRHWQGTATELSIFFTSSAYFYRIKPDYGFSHFSLSLRRDDLRTFFSHLLIGLSVFDGLYLFLSLIEAFRRSFHMATTAHVFLFAYVLGPLHSLSMLISIYLTIAIAVER